VVAVPDVTPKKHKQERNSVSEPAHLLKRPIVLKRLILMALCIGLIAGTAIVIWLWSSHQNQLSELNQIGDLTQTGQSAAKDIEAMNIAATVESVKSGLTSTVAYLIICFGLIIAGVLSLWALYHQRIVRPQQSRANSAHQQLIAARERLDTQSKRDALTDTSNRKAITRFLSGMQRSGQHSEGEFVALAIVDIDYFQQINDVLGYFAGDEVLREIARRIHGELRVEDKLGRLEADRFAIVLCGLVAPRTGETIIHRIQQVLSHPIVYKDSTVNVTTTVGACVQEISVMDISELFKLSDQALQNAKRDHRGSVLLLSDQAQEALSRQRAIVTAIKSHEPGELFDLVYQPIVQLEDNRIAGFECLLRWKRDTPAEMQADEFVPILEMYDDFHTVGEWVMACSLEQLKQWKTANPDRLLFMSINISAIQLEDNDFAERTMKLVSRLALDPAEVTLELTETVAIKHLESGRKQLALLRNMGLGISLDDFGTGYSSLQYLKVMPASTVKIDQTFVRHMMNDARDAAIVDSAIHIAQAIGLKVVAEGVDSIEQEQKLRSAGCQYVQGYYYSPPLNAEEMTLRLATQP